MEVACAGAVLLADYCCCSMLPLLTPLLLLLLLAPQDDDDLVQSLADEVAAWLGIGDVVVKGRRALPAAAVLLKQPGSS